MNRSIKDYNPAPCTSVPFLLDTVLYPLFITIVVATHLAVAYEIITLIF